MNDLEGYSRALYSNWLWHKPTQLVVDAGEGLHLALGSHIWQPNIVAITHGHSDHVLGLAGFAGARRFGKGATAKRWTVLYPAASTGVLAVRDLIAALWRGVDFPIEWAPMEPGRSHPLSLHRTIEAFAVQHVAPEPSIGYRVVEQRRRLKAEFRDWPSQDVERAARVEGRDALLDDYQHVVFAHSGDAMPIDSALAREADLLVHDATFLGDDERREPIHATSAEVFATAREARVARLVVNHLSVRYERRTAIPHLKQQLAASGFKGQCWLLDEGTFIDLRT